MASHRSNTFPEVRHFRILLLVIILAAALARAPMLDKFRFHPDETLFAALARLILNGTDPLLARTHLLVDKPPLFYYTLAAGVGINWGAELAARLPGFFAGVLSTALIARLTRLLWRDSWAGLAASLCYALSPFAISFAPTAFADPLMVMWWLAALCAVLEDRWGLGGLMSGLALATKGNALFLLPLVPLIGVLGIAHRKTSRHQLAAAGLRFAAGFLPVALAWRLWDSARGFTASSWAAGLVHNDPGRLARSLEVPGRLAGWLNWLKYLAGGHILALVPVAVLVGVGVIRARSLRERALAVALAAYGLAYFGLHWLVAFPIFDRYMLPLVPLAAVLAGSGIVRIGHMASHQLPGQAKYWQAALLLASALALLPGAAHAARGDYPVGGDHGGMDGLEIIAARLAAVPWGSVVYTDTLGWPLAYYTMDSGIYLAAFDNPTWLEQDLRVQQVGAVRRYLVMQAALPQRDVLDAVDAAGCQLEMLLRTRDQLDRATIDLYQITDCAAP